MGYLWNFAFAISIAWMAHRIHQVLQKPTDELVEILGFDIPPVPDVALSSITTNSVLLYRKSPDNYQTPMKLHVQVNGINVGEFEKSDASISISGLQPGAHYGIRAIATSANGHSSFGRQIHVQTIPLSGHRGSQSPSSPSNGAVSGRQLSSALDDGALETRDQGGGESDVEASEATLVKLTKKLDSLRRQKEDIDLQLAEAVEENERTRQTLSQERDDMRKVVEDKDKTSLEFKKQVNEVEKQYKAAQRKRSTKERLLKQKKAEREKLLGDIAKWRVEEVEMQNEIQSTAQEIKDVESALETEMEDCRKANEEIYAENRKLEEGIREWGNKIKELEAERREQDRAQDEEEREIEQREKQAEAAYERRIRGHQEEYTSLWTIYQQKEAMIQQGQDRLEYLLALRQKDPARFAPIPGLDFASLGAPPAFRRSRHHTSGGSTGSHLSESYPLGVSLMSGMSGMPTSSPVASPYFHVSNGVTTSSPAAMSSLGMPREDALALSSGVPLSPSASTFLPSDLLGDDDLPRSHANGRASIPLHGSFAYGAGNEHADAQSPVSVDSRSPSVLSSPHDSLPNLHGYRSSRERAADGEPYALGHDTPFTGTGISRLTGLFSFNRQRGKTMDEPPSLGSLKQGQSQSFPRSLESPPFESSGHAGRRSGSGAWIHPMERLLPGRHAGSASENGRGAFPRRPRLAIWGSKIEAERPALFAQEPSSRPTSTYSYDHAMQRPASNGHAFPWMSGIDGHPRSSPFGADWSTMSHPTWSGTPSRRASIHHGSTSNLSIGSTPLDLDQYSPPYGVKSTPIPIGTERFQLSKRSSNAPKLNPAAPSFTTRLFARNDTKKATSETKHAGKEAKQHAKEAKKAAKSEKQDRKAEKGRGKEREVDKAFDIDSESLHDDTSPSASRVSRDTHSIAASTSLGDQDSVDATHPSSPSDLGSSSAPRESLMQRLTRKSSSGVFNVPWSEKSRILFSKKTGETTTAAPDEGKEEGWADEAASAGMAESATSTPTGLDKDKDKEREREREKATRGLSSWSRVMRKSKKGDVPAPASESSGKVSEAEIGEDDE